MNSLSVVFFKKKFCVQDETQVKNTIEKTIDHIPLMDIKNISQLIFDYHNQSFLDLCKQSCSIFNELLHQLESLYKHKQPKLDKIIVLTGSSTICSLLINYCVVHHSNQLKFSSYEFPTTWNPLLFQYFTTYTFGTKPGLITLQGQNVLNFFTSTNIRHIFDETQDSHVLSFIVHIPNEIQPQFIEYIDQNPDVKERCSIYNFNEVENLDDRCLIISKDSANFESLVDNSLFDFLL